MSRKDWRQLACGLAVVALLIAVFLDVEEHRWGLAAAAIALFIVGEVIDSTPGPQTA